MMHPAESSRVLWRPHHQHQLKCSVTASDGGALSGSRQRLVPTEETEAMSDEWLPMLGVFLCLLNWKLISEAVSDSVCSENKKHL